MADDFRWDIYIMLHLGIYIYVCNCEYMYMYIYIFHVHFIAFLEAPDDLSIISMPNVGLRILAVSSEKLA